MVLGVHSDEMANLGLLLSRLPEEVLQNEIVARIGRLSMTIVRHVLLGYAIDDEWWGMVNLCCDGIEFYKWCTRNIRHYDVNVDTVDLGGQDVIEYMILNGGGPCMKVCVFAAMLGRLDYLKFAKTWDVVFPQNILNFAAEGGKLEVIKYLVGVGCKMPDDMCMNAALGGNLEVLKWSVENGGGLYYDACKYATKGGSLECLLWLKSIGYRIYMDEFPHAIKANSIEIVKYIFECMNGIRSCTPRIQEYCCLEASKHQNAECLKCLVDQGFTLDKDQCIIQAAGYDSLECLKFLHSIGCKLSVPAVLNAAACNSLSCLIWMQQMGCKIDLAVCKKAVVFCSFECFKYACQNCDDFDSNYLAKYCKIKPRYMRWLMRFRGDGSKQ